MLSLEKDLPSLEKDLPSLEEGLPSLEKDLPSLEKDLPSLEKDLPSLEEGLPSLENVLPSLLEKDYLNLEGVSFLEIILKNNFYKFGCKCIIYLRYFLLLQRKEFVK